MKHAIVMLSTSLPAIANVQLSPDISARDRRRAGIAGPRSETTDPACASLTTAAATDDVPRGADQPAGITIQDRRRQIPDSGDAGRVGGIPGLEDVLAAAGAHGIDAPRYAAYACRRWGADWYRTPHGRWLALDEIMRYRNDADGLVDKIDSWLARG